MNALTEWSIAVLDVDGHGMAFESTDTLLRAEDAALLAFNKYIGVVRNLQHSSTHNLLSAPG